MLDDALGPSNAAFLSLRSAELARSIVAGPLVPLQDQAVYARPSSANALADETCLPFRPTREAFAAARGTALRLGRMYWHARASEVDAWLAGAAGARADSIALSVDDAGHAAVSRSRASRRRRRERRARRAAAADVRAARRLEPLDEAEVAWMRGIGRWREVAPARVVRVRAGLHPTHRGPPGKGMMARLRADTANQLRAMCEERFGRVASCVSYADARDPSASSGRGRVTFEAAADARAMLAAAPRSRTTRPSSSSRPCRSWAATMTRPRRDVRGLHVKTTDAVLRDQFAAYGDVLNAYVKRDPATRASTRYGFVTFEDGDLADALCELPARIGIEGAVVEIRPSDKSR